MGINNSKKLLLIKYVGYFCENCKNKFKLNKLEIHRINRGCSYEEYRSLMVLCEDCHKLIHFNENGIQGR